jgi:hypothetical protein
MAESELNQKGSARRRRVLGDAAVEPWARDIDSDLIIRSSIISAESGSQC